KVMSKLEELVGDMLIEDLPIPVTTVATDLIRQREVWFQNGPLLQAIRASIAVPGVITPVHVGGQVLVDGGLLNPLPIMPILATHEADFVVAVNVTAHSPQPITLAELLPSEDTSDSRTALERDRDANIGGWMDDVRATTRRLWDGLGGSNGEENDVDETVDLRGRREWGKLDMILESCDINQAALAKYKIAGYPPDVLIEIPKTVCSTYEFHRANELIRLGRHLADEALERRMPSIASDATE
ncbi:MAG: patatin-like phospholipase family protein, partial [Halomonas venusta]|nr:patatin-like phospholipase family protein [Halomonas venusta]